ncbi:hypothetical protein DQZ30_19480 [Salmonella enterica subsp. diarizonae]|nr:hypothetical protein [Salmonella enterica subsp. diarizonae]
MVITFPHFHISTFPHFHISTFPFKIKYIDTALKYICNLIQKFYVFIISLFINVIDWFQAKIHPEKIFHFAVAHRKEGERSFAPEGF